MNPGHQRRVALAVPPLTLLAPVLAAHGRGRQARRAEGAPLMTVKKILTATPLRAAGRSYVQRLGRASRM
jgi:hypothetical protein